jgi:hypothetical protein
LRPTGRSELTIFDRSEMIDLVGWGTDGTDIRARRVDFENRR